MDRANRIFKMLVRHCRSLPGGCSSCWAVCSSSNRVVLFQLRDHPLLAAGSPASTPRPTSISPARCWLATWGSGPGLYFVSPFYIYFLAAGLAVFDSFTAVRVLQIVLGTASVAFIFLMARAWFGERAAWIAGALAALTGLLTFYEVLILQASIDAFLTSAALYLPDTARTSVALHAWTALAAQVCSLAGAHLRPRRR